MKKNILILYSIPLKSNKYNNWSDGFTAAIDLLKDNYHFIYQNVNDKTISDHKEDYRKIDLIFIKANWDARLEKLAFEKLKNIDIKKALLISGSKEPPSKARLMFYDLLYYETEWYKKIIEEHPLIIHAFGIYKDKMTPNHKIEKDIDYLSVGSFKFYKRLHLMPKLKGNKLIIGEIPKKLKKNTLQDYLIYYYLKLRNITILDFMDYAELNKYYTRAKNIYIPAKVNGGGERAVLEARSSGINVIVENDNPKLLSLLNSPIYDHKYYSEQLELGIKKVL